MKKLIYYSVGNDINYLNILKLSLESLNKFDFDGDILFITNFEEDIKNLISFKNNIFFLNENSPNLFHSSANKLKIYNYNLINNYDKIIYVDIDTIWLKSTNNLFDIINDEKIYITSEYHQSSLMCEIYWSGNLMTNEENEYIRNNQIKGLNAGIFGFKISLINKIKEIDEFMYKNISEIPICLEQPFINTYLLRNSLYDLKFNEQISNNGNSLSVYDGTLLHFSGGIGNPKHKYDNMIKFI